MLRMKMRWQWMGVWLVCAAEVRAETTDGGPPVEPLASRFSATGIKAKEMEKAIKEAFDKRDGVVPDRVPQATERGGVPTDKLGDSLPEIKAFPVRDVMADAELFDGQRLLVRGLVRRMAQDGSWLKLLNTKARPWACG